MAVKPAAEPENCEGCRKSLPALERCGGCRLRLCAACFTIDACGCAALRVQLGRAG